MGSFTRKLRKIEERRERARKDAHEAERRRQREDARRREDLHRAAQSQWVTDATAAALEPEPQAPPRRPVRASLSLIAMAFAMLGVTDMPSIEAFDKDDER